MAVVSTLPKPGSQAKFYEIPDADLDKYQALEVKAVGESDNAPEGGGNAEQVEAPGSAIAGGDVEAYRHRQIRRCFVYNTRTGYIYYWYWCYA